jgi:cephalosporin hydroxylase
VGTRRPTVNRKGTPFGLPGWFDELVDLKANIRQVQRRAEHELSHRAHQTTMRDIVASTNNFGDVTWLGYPIWQNVLDLWVLQEAISEIKPSLVLETGTNRGGSALFYSHLMGLLGIEPRVVTVDVERLHDLDVPGVEFVIGDSVGGPVLDRMRAAAESVSGPVLVVLDSNHASDHVYAEMSAYSEFVTPNSLMLVQDGAIDTLRAFAVDRPGPLDAIQRWLPHHPEFQIETRWDERFILTHHPRGWLRRKSGP